MDIQVENALLKRALGYDYQEQRIEKSDKDGTKIIQTIRHVPADTTAQIFWLKTADPTSGGISRKLQVTQMR